VINASDAIRRLIKICGINDSIRQEYHYAPGRPAVNGVIASSAAPSACSAGPSPRRTVPDMGLGLTIQDRKDRLAESVRVGDLL
jgi:hypothetical protein